MFNAEINMVVCIVQHQQSHYDKPCLPTSELSCILARKSHNSRLLTGGRWEVSTQSKKICTIK